MLGSIVLFHNPPSLFIFEYFNTGDDNVIFSYDGGSSEVVFLRFSLFSVFGA